MAFIQECLSQSNPLETLLSRSRLDVTDEDYDFIVDNVKIYVDDFICETQEMSYLTGIRIAAGEPTTWVVGCTTFLRDNMWLVLSPVLFLGVSFALWVGTGYLLNEPFRESLKLVYLDARDSVKARYESIVSVTSPKVAELMSLKNEIVNVDIPNLIGDVKKSILGSSSESGEGRIEECDVLLVPDKGLVDVSVANVVIEPEKLEGPVRDYIDNKITALFGSDEEKKKK
jgi:hypothetical protein